MRTEAPSHSAESNGVRKREGGREEGREGGTCTADAMPRGRAEAGADGRSTAKE